MFRVCISGCLAVLSWLLAGTAELRADPPAPKGLWERTVLLPDPGGHRAKLADEGVVFSLIYTGEVFGNPVGGYRQGAVYDGLLAAGLDADLEKFLGWKGLKFHALAYETHGPSGTAKYTRDLNFYSSIDAFDSAWLFDLWLESSLWHNVVNLRIGQQAVDTEFATTIGGALFIHSNFGALPTMVLNVPAPSYPEAAPGARLRLNTPDGRCYFQSGVYSGNPNADRDGDPDPTFRRGTAYDDHGTRFPISGNQGLLAVAEAGYLRNYHKEDPGLPGAYRLGGFYHTGGFSDQRLDSTGRSLADPLSNGVPRRREGNGGIYAVAEQVIYRPHDPHGGNEDVATSAAAPIGNAEDSPLGINGAPPPAGPQARLFGRMGVGQGDRSLSDFYAEAGFNFRALLPGREADILGLGVTYTDLSGDRRARLRDANRFSGTHGALSDYEALLEGTYQINLAPWLSVQPDVQYIVHPGGSGQFGNALVVGVRTVVTF